MDVDDSESSRSTPLPINKTEREKEERMRHAKVVRDLLVLVNKQYKERFGTPPPVTSAGAGVSGVEGASRDVEMVAA